MNSKSCGHPIRIGRVTCGTIHRYIQLNVIGIHGGIEVGSMTCRALCRCSCKTIGMTSNALCVEMLACEWKIGSTMVKCIILIAIRVASKASRIVKYVPTNAFVFIIRFWISVTNCTTENTVITWRCMALYAVIPYTIVFSTVNWKIHGIVSFIFSRHPSRIGRMTLLTVYAEICQLMIRLLGIFKVGFMTRNTICTDI